MHIYKDFFIGTNHKTNRWLCTAWMFTLTIVKGQNLKFMKCMEFHMNCRQKNSNNERKRKRFCGIPPWKMSELTLRLMPNDILTSVNKYRRQSSREEYVTRKDYLRGERILGRQESCLFRQARLKSGRTNFHCLNSQLCKWQMTAVSDKRSEHSHKRERYGDNKKEKFKGQILDSGTTSTKASQEDSWRVQTISTDF